MKATLRFFNEIGEDTAKFVVLIVPKTMKIIEVGFMACLVRTIKSPTDKINKPKSI